MKVEEIETSRIIPYANNPRHNDQAVSAVAASIKEFGFRQPIVTDEALVVLVGHTRLKAAQNLGLKVVPVHIAEGLTEAQKKAYRIADNRLNELAEWDKDILKEQLEELATINYDLGVIGFDVDELSSIFDETAHLPIEEMDTAGGADAVSTIIVEAKTKDFVEVVNGISEVVAQFKDAKITVCDE